MVGDVCFSACVFAFLGGTERSATQEAQMGFHGMRWDIGTPPAEQERVRSLLRRYVTQMGASPDLAAEASAESLGAEPVLLGPARLAELRILGSSVPPRRLTSWRIQAVQQGNLVGYVSERIDAMWSISLGLTKLEGRYRLLVHIRPSELNTVANNLLERSPDRMPVPEFMILERTWRPAVYKPWTKVSQGLQMWFSVGEDDLSQFLQATSFRLTWVNSNPPMIEPPEIQIGTAGLDQIIRALKRSN
jgi:hypothetical protein